MMLVAFATSLRFHTRCILAPLDESFLRYGHERR